MAQMKISDYPNYEITDDGRVWSQTFSIWLNHNIGRTGYHSVMLYGENGPKRIKIHRLVLTHFGEKIPGKSHINHKDGNKDNNHISNLEWCTHSENIKHAWENGMKEKTRASSRTSARILGKSMAKPVAQLDRNGNIIAEYPSSKDASIATGLSASHIGQLANGRFKQSSYHFKFK